MRMIKKRSRIIHWKTIYKKKLQNEKFKKKRKKGLSGGPEPRWT